MLEWLSASRMHQLEERKQFLGAEYARERERPRLAFEDVWKGPNNDPLFFN